MQTQKQSAKKKRTTEQESSLPEFSEEPTNIFLREFELEDFISFKCTHIAFFLCWFGLVLAGTTIIGFGASNFSELQEYCDEGEPFCFYDLTLDSTRSLSFYVKLYPFNQNNRMYLDAYSLKQAKGEVGTGAHCGSFKTFKSLDIKETEGGYRVPETNHAHPCGFPMLTLFNDSLKIVESDGGTPDLTENIISSYSLNNRFQRLDNYPISQWIDTQSNEFINWFTIGVTSTKYVQLGRLNNMNSGDYRLIIKNSYPTQGEFTKQLLISEVNSLGITNHLLGFAIFAYGIAMLLIHVVICCKSTD